MTLPTRKPLQQLSILSLTTLVLLLGSTSALAIPDFLNTQPRLAQTSGGRRGGAKLMQELNLSRDQIQQLQALRQRYQPQIRDRHQSLRQANQCLQQLLSGTASSAQIRNQRRKVTALRGEIDDLRFESLLEMRNILTPEQRQKWAELVKGRRDTIRDRLEQRRRSDRRKFGHDPQVKILD